MQNVHQKPNPAVMATI